jgi:hypothetical protein
LSATTCTPAATASSTRSRWRGDRHDVDPAIEQPLLGVIDRDSRIVLSEFRAALRIPGDDAGQFNSVGRLDERSVKVPPPDAVADKS